MALSLQIVRGIEYIEIIREMIHGLLLDSTYFGAISDSQRAEAFETRYPIFSAAALGKTISLTKEQGLALVLNEWRFILGLDAKSEGSLCAVFDSADYNFYCPQEQATVEEPVEDSPNTTTIATLVVCGAVMAIFITILLLWHNRDAAVGEELPADFVLLTRHLVPSGSIESDLNKVPVELKVSHLVFFGECLGKGKFGRVDLAKYTGLSECTPSFPWITVAVKTAHSHVADAQKLEDDLLSEAAIMAQLDHPNNTKLIGVVTSTKPHQIVMEHCQ